MASHHNASQHSHPLIDIITNHYHHYTKLLKYIVISSSDDPCTLKCYCSDIDIVWWHRDTAKAKDIVTTASHSSSHSYRWLLTYCYSIAVNGPCRSHQGQKAMPKYRDRDTQREKELHPNKHREMGEISKLVLTSDILIHHHPII